MLPSTPAAQAAPRRRKQNAWTTAVPGTAPGPAGRSVLRRALLGLALGTGMVACGQVGPLYQPPAEQQQEPAEPAAP
jgi:predicted small lipoprotein YifL